ncbi:MAG TPA: ATP-binding protein, partial [Gaiellaceae bacterium]
VREAIVGLRTPAKGLVPTIREYLRRLPRLEGCEIELRVDDEVEDVALVPSTEIQLVRIVQEALSNVRKHAGASRVEVIVDANENAVGVQIVDDGHGFDPLVLDRTGWPRLGLQTMRERAQAVGGTFDVFSAPGEGTRVAVHVPANAWEAMGAGTAR